ncbi:unnamed protein product [Cladocopium goreaui]|uniref:Intraflagellar transport protein 20 homolog A n=1 Tax=Cladocopium goreaui TaxID=2562237 RepID=A0A9P1C3S0_9DINO|nr:unnamed protein product [Cladocopium goreaui]
MHSKDPHSVEGSSPTHVNHKQQLVATCRNLRKLTPASVKSALQKVLGDPSYAQRARELQGMMLKTKGAEACVEAIERFVENDGCDELFLRAPPSWSSYVTPWVKPLCLLALGAALGAIRELVLSEVEFKVQEKSEEMLMKGKEVVAQMQQRHREKMQQLVEEIGQCQLKQHELERENGRLKQTLHNLESQFTMIGNTYLNGKDFASPESVSTTEADTVEPPSSQVPPSTPQPRANYGSDDLPEVPTFPFSPVPMGSPPAISIAESLGPSTPQRTPVSLLQSLTPMPSPFTVNGRAGAGLVGGCGIFSFTLRKADGAELGLNVSHTSDDRCLCVEGIREGGAVEAWNRQCGVGTSFAEKAVFPGDRIISVNQICYDPSKMLQECRDKQLLKLTIARGNVPLPAPPQELRAEASEFVPGSNSKSKNNKNKEEEEPGVGMELAGKNARNASGAVSELVQKLPDLGYALIEEGKAPRGESSQELKGLTRSDKAAPENTPKALGRWRCPAMEGLEITFDEDNRIRVMPKEKFKQTEDLEAECNGFAEKIQAFSGTVDMLVEVLDGEALKIEEEKLRAIGQRNRAEMEAEARRRKQLSMEAAIKEKTQELERLTFQLNSLEKVEREQQALIEKLSNLDWCGPAAKRSCCRHHGRCSLNRIHTLATKVRA